jgi:hypothetical protein
VSAAILQSAVARLEGSVIVGAEIGWCLAKAGRHRTGGADGVGDGV